MQYNKIGHPYVLNVLIIVLHIEQHNSFIWETTIQYKLSTANRVDIRLSFLFFYYYLSWLTTYLTSWYTRKQIALED